MEVLALIQARGGSKGVPGKNIRMLGGKPLIAWTVEAARKAPSVNRVIISTDSAEIADAARIYGAEVPFIRPAEFATDDAKSIGLLRHALLWLEEHEGYRPDALVQLKPTNPLRTSAHIEDAIRLFKESSETDAVITVRPVREHPYKTWKRTEDGRIEPFIQEDYHHIKEAVKSPRQKLPEAFIQNSCVHVIRPSTILEQNSSIGTNVRVVVMSEEDSLNIDTPNDFALAELLFAQRNAV
ncbi:MAG: acylneuraminate cytidylyltransferase family protein [Candidatus Vogelbacteria bacterium]|nr:acylneuraminate cytidylyltransferase family protein [Candidatus Vogelbacteria bacterium]